MIEVREIQIISSNGSESKVVMKTKDIPSFMPVITDDDELDRWRKTKQKELQKESNAKWLTENPGSSEHDIKLHAPKIELLIIVWSDAPKGYIQRKPQP